MNHMEKFNNAISYIEDHLAEEIDYKQVERRACCSVDHFQRMFSFITNISLSEYIRRRRLTLAAFDLCEGAAKIIEVAAKYGYSSPEAFSRAFKNLHGAAPTNVRNPDTALRAYPRLSFCLSLGGEADISYRIVQKQAHEVCGIITNIPAGSEKTNTLITQFWEENIRKGVIGQFHRDIGLAYDTCLNAALFDRHPHMFSYMICYDVPYGSAPRGYSALSVPPLTWAVFSTPEHTAQETTELVRSMRQRIFMEWFPTSAYMHADGPEFEIFKNDRGKFVVDIWVPINKK